MKYVLKIFYSLNATYNCACYIRQAIKSILLQTYTDFEFLIIDDGSTDTEEIVKSFNDSRIVFIKKEFWLSFYT